jgi:hypothetical protein
MTEITLEALREILRAELAPIRDELAVVRARVDGIPLIWSAVDAVQRDMRMLRAAINDMARTNITAGEVEALHADVDKVQSKQLELETRIITLERLIKEQ